MRLRYDLAVAAHGAVYFLNSPIRTTSSSELVHMVGTSLIRTSLPKNDCNEVAAGTATALLAVCGHGEAGRAMGAREIYESSDSGRSFQRLPGPGRGGGYDGSGVADAGNGHAVVGTLSGELGELRSTSDGAHTWHTSLRVGHADFGDLGFEDGTHGVVIVIVNGTRPDGRLYRTSNGGAAWTRVTFA